MSAENIGGATNKLPTPIEIAALVPAEESLEGQTTVEQSVDAESAVAIDGVAMAISPDAAGVHPGYGEEHWTPEMSKLAERIFKNETVRIIARELGRQYPYGDADDLVQETIMRIARSRIALDPFQDFRGLAINTMQWVVIDAVRHVTVPDSIAPGDRRKRRTVELPFGIGEFESPGPQAVTPDIADGVIAELMLRELREPLATLSFKHSQILDTVYLRELSVAEAAAELKISEGTVKSRTFYALRTLRTALGIGSTE